MKKKSSYPLEIILNLNQKLFLNALKGVTDEQAKQRLSDHNNSLIWVATHIIWARYNTTKLLGKPGNNPYPGMFENFKPFDESMKFPTLDKVKAEWKTVSDLLKEGFASATDEFMESESPFKSPIGDNSFTGAIAFLTEHESYEIGQLGLLKKLHTKEAMSYE
jgi:hypothetical protein